MLEYEPKEDYFLKYTLEDFFLYMNKIHPTSMVTDVSYCRGREGEGESQNW